MSKTWFITGASSGFGRELAELLLQRGDRVAATVRKPDALQNLVAKYGDRLWVAILDVTDSAAVRNVVDRAFSELQRIDVVVSNAGYALFGAAEEAGDAQIERQLDTNLLGSILRLCSTSRNAPPTETQPAASCRHLRSDQRLLSDTRKISRPRSATGPRLGIPPRRAATECP